MLHGHGRPNESLIKAQLTSHVQERRHFLDGASVNGAAMWTMKEVMFPSMMNIICVSHTLDNVGKHMDATLLNNFLQRWITLFAYSPVIKFLWKTQTSFVVGL